MSTSRGWTLIEALVTLAIIGLLAAILVPAVQYAREAARRATCANHLHQLGVAMHAYHSHHECFPPGEGGNGHSFLARMLPELGMNELYNSINFSAPAQSVPALGLDRRANTTILAKTVSLFICPSDLTPPREAAKPNAVLPAYTNYAGVYNAWPGRENGVFAGLKGVQASHISGGLSNTVVVSEWQRDVGNILDTSKITRVVWNLLVPWEEMPELCETLDTSRVERSGVMKGQGWLAVGHGQTLYDHVLAPGRLSCWGGDTAIAASSVHSGGVNVLIADGSVRFVSNSIERHAWQELGDK